MLLSGVGLHGWRGDDKHGSVCSERHLLSVGDKLREFQRRISGVVSEMKKGEVTAWQEGSKEVKKTT
uniref:Uncharacterized protein n=1 Tax=viral metagenome TaxID=1070528 RepID=A0A6M3IFB7_9ZZZZ